MDVHGDYGVRACGGGGHAGRAQGGGPAARALEDHIRHHTKALMINLFKNIVIFIGIFYDICRR